MTGPAGTKKKNHKLVATAFIKLNAKTLESLGVYTSADLEQLATTRLQAGLEQLLESEGLGGNTVSVQVTAVT